jgi:outer membrane protein OmpA-like peptidoglycan-associated protein
VIFGNRYLVIFICVEVFLGLVGTDKKAHAQDSTFFSDTTEQTTSPTNTATSSTNSSSDASRRFGSKYNGTIGLGLIGAELGFVIPAIAGVRSTWSLTVFPLVGAAGGAMGGYFLLDKGARHPAAAFDILMVGAMALVIPGMMLTTWASSHRAKERPGTAPWTLAINRQVTSSSRSDASELASAQLILPVIRKDDLQADDSPPPPADADKNVASAQVNASLEVAGSSSADSKNYHRLIPSPTGLSTEIPQQITFNRVRANITPKNLQTLEAVVRILRQHPEIKHLKIEGHADSTGGAEVNMALSVRRAYRVLKWLREHGVHNVRITFHGYGSEKPIAPNDTDEGRRANRRVEFRIDPD